MTSDSIVFETYYCYHCGTSQSHAKCGARTVYMHCRGCGSVVMFSKEIDGLVSYWQRRVSKLKMLIAQHTCTDEEH